MHPAPHDDRAFNHVSSPTFSTVLKAAFEMQRWELVTTVSMLFDDSSAHAAMQRSRLAMAGTMTGSRARARGLELPHDGGYHEYSTPHGAPR